jgi:hypothetical protein
VDPDRRLAFLALPLLAAFVLAAGQEPRIIRVSDAVGDTIDRAERDSFQLFPNTTGFQHATIIELLKPEILADVTLTDGDSARRVFFQLAPSQLEKIRYLIDNRDIVQVQVDSDSGSVRALAAFWESIEGVPLTNASDDPTRPLNVLKTPSAPPPGSDSGSSVSHANAFSYGLHGATLGSMAGGCVGSHAGIRYTRTVDASCLCPAHDVYTLDPGVFWGASCGLTALGTGIGTAVGAKLDRERPAEFVQLKEGTRWRTGLAVGGFVAGAAAGFGTFMLTAYTRYGVFRNFNDEILNDPDHWTILPMAFTGLCIAVEGATIGYQIGRATDRAEAEKAETRRRALGR